MADEKEPVERVSANPGGVDQHRPLMTSDLPLIAEYVAEVNKPRSRPTTKPTPKAKPKGEKK